MTNNKNLNTQTTIPKNTQYEVENMKEKKNKETRQKDNLLRPKAGALSVLSLEEAPFGVLTRPNSRPATL